MESIKFTIEKEQNGELPILDTLVKHHTDGSLSSSSVYRKWTHTDKYLDFQFHHPLAHKLSVLRTLISWASFIYSFIGKPAEECHVTNILHQNGYPR